MKKLMIIVLAVISVGTLSQEASAARRCYSSWHHGAKYVTCYRNNWRNSEWGDDWRWRRGCRHHQGWDWYED